MGEFLRQGTQHLLPSPYYNHCLCLGREDYLSDLKLPKITIANDDSTGYVITTFLNVYTLTCTVCKHHLFILLCIP